jgi:hypothetical protein
MQASISEVDPSVGHHAARIQLHLLRLWPWRRLLPPLRMELPYARSRRLRSRVRRSKVSPAHICHKAMTCPDCVAAPSRTRLPRDAIRRPTTYPPSACASVDPR